MKRRETKVIEKGSPIFDKAKWVAKARSKDTYRYGMQGIYVSEDGKWIATDGHRMHIWNNAPEYAPGLYQVVDTTKVITLTPDDDNQFPKWENVVPNYEKEFAQSLHFGDKAKSDYAGNSIAVFKLFDATKACFNLSFLTDLGDHSWDVYGEDPDHSFHFKNETLEVVMMPLKVKD